MYGVLFNNFFKGLGLVVFFVASKNIFKKAIGIEIGLERHSYAQVLYLFIWIFKKIKNLLINNKKEIKHNFLFWMKFFGHNCSNIELINSDLLNHRDLIKNSK